MDPLPILTYADATVESSGRDRLIYTRTETGFCLADPRPDVPRWLFSICGGTLLLISAVIAFAMAVNHADFFWAELFCPCIPAAFGTACVLRAWQSYAPPRMITFSNGKLTATGLSWSIRRQIANLHKNPDRLFTTVVDFLTFRPKYDLRLSTWCGMHLVVFAALPGDEADRARNLLRSAINGVR